MPLSVANGSMGVQYLPWVINEHCHQEKKYRRQSGTGFEDAGDVTGPYDEFLVMCECEMYFHRNDRIRHWTGAI